MNILKKLAFGTVAAIGFAGPAAASPSLLVALPDISVVTAEVGRWIAEEFHSLEKALLNVPRATRPERASSVTIFEGPNHMIVTASRLPSDAADATLAVQL
jgi:hypothetical protein